MILPSRRARLFVAVSAVAFVLLNNVIAAGLVFAAYGFDAGLFVADGELVTRRLGTADLLRWGALIDMLGYLAAGPVVSYMYAAAARRGLGNQVLAVCGLGFAFVGAIGAVLLASAGAWLLGPAVNDAALGAARVAYGALENAVFVGLWGTLELLLLGVWFAGVGRSLIVEDRAFGYAAILAGVGCLAYSVRTGITGRPPLPIDGPLDVAILTCVAFIPIWMLWLAFRLIVTPAERGDRPQCLPT